MTTVGKYAIHTKELRTEQMGFADKLNGVFQIEGH